jgi:predicted kinase
MQNENIPRNLIVMIGMTAAGKTYHVDKFYLAGHQIVSSRHIREAIKTTKLPDDTNLIYMTMELIVRANMIKGLPIVVDENNLTIESLFFWKKLCSELNYILKGVVLDTPLEVCVKRFRGLLKEPMTEEMHEKLKKEYEQVEELKVLLNMKHQQVLDRVSYITYDGG